MRKYMNEVCVYTTEDGEIVIQTPGGYEEFQSVAITPDQADAVAGWILEAKNELAGRGQT